MAATKKPAAREHHLVHEIRLGILDVYRKTGEAASMADIARELGFQEATVRRTIHSEANGFEHDGMVQWDGHNASGFLTFVPTRRWLCDLWQEEKVKAAADAPSYSYVVRELDRDGRTYEHFGPFQTYKEAETFAGADRELRRGHRNVIDQLVSPVLALSKG